MHDFNKFPELTNAQMQLYYFESPHKQITEDFRAMVVKVTDGDTVRLKAEFRDFDFPLRFLDIAAPEVKEKGGTDSQNWLEEKILNQEVDIIINPKLRVGKWGRLLGHIFFNGMDIGEESMNNGHSIPWAQRKDGVIMNFEKEMKKIW